MNQPTSQNTHGTPELSDSDPFVDCPIWPSFPSRIAPNEDGTLTIFSPRTGGEYRISTEAALLLGTPTYRYGRVCDRLTTWLIDQRMSGVGIPYVRPAIVEYAFNRRMLSVMERAERLLTFLAGEARELGGIVQFSILSLEEAEILGGGPAGLEHVWSKPTNLKAYACSESEHWDAVEGLLGYLERHGYITAITDRIDNFSSAYVVEVEGYSKVETILGSTASNQAFVAMWFDASMDDAYENGIAPAIESAGFSAKVINRDPTVDKIDDAIVAEIRKSKFIVADFTHGDKGARGGVYFEAGFAMGLGIPVIYTCRKDMIDEVHFDTRQYNHIVWSDPNELRLRLQERIEARIT